MRHLTVSFALSATIILNQRGGQDFHLKDPGLLSVVWKFTVTWPLSGSPTVSAPVVASEFRTIHARPVDPLKPVKGVIGENAERVWAAIVPSASGQTQAYENLRAVPFLSFFPRGIFL